jgi:cell division protein FtsA
MYSTCIGLILRGYHDFENGRMRFTGEGGNYIHINEAEMQSAFAAPRTAAPEVATTEELVAEAELKNEKSAKRSETMKRLFDGLKGKFMSIFEEVEDQEIE